MSFYLSEAYSNLYNPRVESNFNDNLRFIDFMEEEDIEEVVESIFWEICDYGNTITESFEILSLAASDKIITEAYEEILTESRSQMMARRAKAEQGLQTQKTRLQGDLRKQARRARVDGAIARVKSAISGARGGMGRASKALGGAVAKARSEGKARLGQLLRRGIRATGGLVGAAGRRISKAGDAVSNLANEKPSRMSRSDYEKRKSERTERAKATVKGSFDKKALPAGRVVSKITGEAPPPPPPRMAAKKPIAALPPASTKKTAREMTPKRKEALEKIGRAAKRRTGGKSYDEIKAEIDKRESGKKDRTLYAKSQKARKALKEYEEILDTLLDALVEEKYAGDYESALNIFLNLSEGMILEMAGDFLVD